MSELWRFRVPKMSAHDIHKIQFSPGPCHGESERSRGHQGRPGRRDLDRSRLKGRVL